MAVTRRGMTVLNLRVEKALNAADGAFCRRKIGEAKCLTEVCVAMNVSI